MPDGGEVEGLQSAVVELSQRSQEMQTTKHLVEQMRQRLLERETERQGEEEMCGWVKERERKIGISDQKQDLEETHTTYNW